MTEYQKRALEIVLDFVEKWNKQDKDGIVAGAQSVLEEFLEKNKS